MFERSHLESVLDELRGDTAFAPFFERDRALIVWSHDAERVLWASPGAALTLGLRRRRFPALTPSHLLARSRLRSLAQGIAPRSGLRLERLRLGDSPLDAPVTCACRLIEVQGQEPVLVTGIVTPQVTMAPVSVQSDQAAALPVQNGTVIPKPVVERPVAETMDTVSPEPQVPLQPIVLEMVQEAASPIPEPEEVAPQEISVSEEELSLPVISSGRFTWEMDAEGRFVRLSPVLAETIGPESAAVEGQPWSALLGSVILDEAGMIAAALASGATWSGKTVLWRVDAHHAVPVALSGAPFFDDEDAVKGYRGFGLVRGGEVQKVAPPQKPAAPEPAASPAPVFATPLNQTSLFEPVVPVEDQEPESTEQDPHEEDMAEPIQETPPEPDPAPLPVSSGARIGAGFMPMFSTSSVQIGARLGEPKAPPLEAVSELVDEADEDELPQVEQTPIAEDEADEEVVLSVAPPTSEAVPEPSVALEAPVPPAPEPAPSTPVSQPDIALSPSEHHAFRAIARALGAEEIARKHQEQAAQEKAQEELMKAAPGAEPQTPVAPEPHVAAPVQMEIVPAIPAAEPLLAGLPFKTSVSQEALLAGLLERLPVGVLVNRGDEALYANRTLLDILDYADIGALMQAGGVPAILRNRASDAHDLLGGPVSLVPRQGDPVTVEAKLSSIDWLDGPATVLSFRRALDPEAATRVKALELDLRAREGRAAELSSILDTATDGVIVLDDKGRILSLNRSAEALFGFEQNEVAGEPVATLLAPESHAMALDYLEGLRENGVASVLNDGREIMGRVRQGGLIPLFMTLGRISHGEEPKFCAVLRDLTAWKKAEGELLNAKRSAETASAQKSDFLAKVSHEIRTPLNAILGFAEVIMEERFGPIGNERYRDYLKDIHASGQHVISLVNDLLDLAKIEAGRLELTFTSVNLNEVAASSVALLQPQANRERIVVRTSFSPKLPSVVADERSMRQIVLNILSNALKFTEAGGQVIISTTLTERGEVALRLRDTGIGMTEKDIEAALEPFRQLATSRKSGGTGLGLPLTKALVEANRGSLQISSARSEGTLVEVLFPPTRVLAE